MAHSFIEIAQILIVGADHNMDYVESGRARVIKQSADRRYYRFEALRVLGG